ncbi:Conserved_hypothetical protein [Hexamita inflata]|uniref:Transglutaminase-like domain-containing protein n=1 Tax=Hexamita inflata TaxID=28002 RepID=A0AA86NR37_9EUKA|nr:Conserved hypothetical protein [Hexamita inflata]
MNFTEETISSVCGLYEKSPYINDQQTQIFLSRLSAVQQVCLKFLLCTLPEQDLDSYSLDFFLAHIDHTLHGCDLFPRVHDDLVFLNFVLCPRVNNEHLEHYKPYFQSQLLPLLQNLSTQQSCLALNYYCASNISYASSDIRTLSPLSLLHSVLGRCGEESTFAVSVLRSVNIPARQIYVPRWSHCDSNHAWVEAFIEGAWVYFGACEPEPMLNRGWFGLNASKAIVLSTKTSVLCQEEGICAGNNVKIVNVTGRYAQVKKLKVSVKNGKNVVQGAKVSIGVVNSAEIFNVAEGESDEKGEIMFTIGIGNAILTVISMDKRTSVEARAEDTQIDIDLEKCNEITEFTQKAPEATYTDTDVITEEMKRIHTEKEQIALKHKQSIENGFPTEENVKQYLQDFTYLTTDQKNTISQMLIKAKGNYKQILEFIKIANQMNQTELGLKIMQSLTKKDFIDVTAETLQMHLEASQGYNDENIICPRIFTEHLTNFKQDITQFFDPQVLDEFKNNHQLLIDYCFKNIQTYKSVYTIIAHPIGVLKSQRGTQLSKCVLFVAICRTIGIPCKIQQEDMTIRAQFHDKALILDQQGNPTQQLHNLTITSPDSLDYFSSFSIALLTDNNYISLDLNIQIDQEATIPLQKGLYRIMTADRTKNEYLVQFFYLNFSAEQSVRINLRQQVISPLNIQLQNQIVREKMMNVEKIVAFVKPGNEPSEHFLNEILGQSQKYVDKLVIWTNEINAKIIEIQQKTSAKMMKYDEILYQELTEELNCQKVLPLVLVLKKQEKSLVVDYITTGYSVGSAEMALKYL